MFFFKTRGRFSVISHLRALPFDEMTEKRPLVLKKPIVNHLSSTTKPEFINN